MVVFEAFVGHDIKSGSDRVYVEATGTGQIYFGVAAGVLLVATAVHSFLFCLRCR